MVMAPDTRYLAVACRCGYIIPLKILSDENAADFHGTPFPATCSECKTTEQYGASQVFVWMGPPPRENFQTHPDFQ
jgi:hypothetical protein